jgi:multiple sugar transport system permease protein
MGLLRKASNSPRRQGGWRKVLTDRKVRTEALTGYFFIAPYLLITITFTIGVIAFAVYISFTSFNLFQPPEFTGFANYAKAFQDAKFIRSLGNVFWYVVIVVPVQTALALGLAVLLNAKIRGSSAFRTIYYAPSVTSSVVITMIFFWLYLKTGYINLFLTKVWGLVGANFEPITWLNNPRGLFASIVAAFGGDISNAHWFVQGPSVTWMAIMFQNIFTTAPTFMIIFLAALQNIPPTLYEAASIDGANRWQQFKSVTVPMLRPVIFLIVVLGTIGTWQIFDQVKILTAGGPLNTTLTPVYLIYSEALGTLGPPRMGFASAMAFLLAAIIFVFTLIQRRYIESGTEQY